ncbi:MAG TPA: DNA polymerase III subunit gamma/tau [Anaerolineaceae bacterium]|nr:DNA polymerase III subunit gamma/tau [Anaerolineaceae bacterium]
MAQALYRTWRPALWDEVVGQDHIVQTLKNAIATDRVGHAYLFAGPKGTGKTTSARLLAKGVNCLEDSLEKRPCNHCANCLAVNEGRFLDLIEIDAASNTSVDDVRELRDKINFSPSQGRFKVYIIDEVHMLSTSAFNALLKTLEEPPSHVIFILCTTEIHKIPATVLSRCQRHEFRRIPVPVIVQKLKELCKQEKIKIDDDALTLIARQATGSMRDAISLVDQLSSISKKITLSIAQDVLGTATNQSVIDLVEASMAGSSGKGLEIIHQALDSGADPRQYARQVVDYLRDLLVIKMDAGKQLELTPEVRATMEAHSARFKMNRLVNMIQAFTSAAIELKANWHPGLGLELAYAEALAPATTPQVEVTAPPEQLPAQPKPTPKAKASSNPVEVAPKPVESDRPSPITGPITLDLVQEHWEALKRAVKSRNTVTSALMNSSRLVDVDGSTVVINFSSDLLRDKMADEQNSRMVCSVMSKYFGQDVRLICTTGERDALPKSGANGGMQQVEETIKKLGGQLREIPTDYSVKDE